MTSSPGPAAHTPADYWAVDVDALASQLGSSREGLSSDEAVRRLADSGPNLLQERRALSRLDVIARQLRSPLLLLLVFAAGASALTGEWFDAGIVMTIVLATVALGYSREYSAQTAAAALRSRLHARAVVLRDGRRQACRAMSCCSRPAVSCRPTACCSTPPTST
jgi:Mg2+-importing ATPase